MLTTSPAAEPGNGTPLSPAAADPRRWLALAAVSLATLMVVLDVSIINIALPQAQQQLGIAEANRHWVVTAYALTFGGLLLLGGKVADFAGRKRTLLISLVGFACASALGGIATTAPLFIAARALQGLFAAALAPAALALVNGSFTAPRERATAFGVYAAVQGTGGAVGLLFGGLLAEYTSWRWCMFVNVPIALVAAAAAGLTVRESRAAGVRRYDIPGAILATGGAGALVAGFTLAAESGWQSAATLGTLAAAAGLLGAFVFTQARHPAPMLPLRILTDRNRGGTYLVSVLIGAGMFGVLLFITYFLQVTLGYLPLRAGLAFLPFSGGIVLGSLAVSALLPRTGPQPPMVLGMLLATLGMLWLTRVSGTSTWLSLVLPAEMLLGVGLGFVFVPLNSTALSGIEPNDAGVASALLNTTQQVGGALGVALLNALYTARTATHLLESPGDAAGAALTAYRLVFAVGSGLFSVATLLTIFWLVSPKRQSSLV